MTSGKQMSNTYALCFNKINFVVIPSYIEISCFYANFGIFGIGYDSFTGQWKENDIWPKLGQGFVKKPLTHSWLRSLPDRNQYIDLLCKSVYWFLYDIDLRPERVN